MLRYLFSLIALLTLIDGVSAEVAPSGNDQIKAIIEQIKKSASIKFSATTVQESIDAAAYELHRMSEITIAASVDEIGATKAISDQLKTDSHFRNPKVTFDAQSLDAVITWAGTLSIPAVGPIDATAELHTKIATSVQLVTDRPTAEFKIAFAVSSLDVKDLKLSHNGQPVIGLVNEIAKAVVDGALIPAQTLFNRVDLRLPTTVTATIELKPEQKKGLTVSFDPKNIALNLQIATLTHIVDGGRLTVAAQEGGALNNVPKPKNIEFGSFRSDFQKMLLANGATWINQGQFAAYVNRGLLSRLAGKILDGGPTCLNASMSDLPTPIDARLRLPAEDSIDCTPTKNCTPTKDCTPTMDCSQNEDCRACVARVPRVCAFGKCVGGNCAQMGNDPLCQARKIKKKAECEAQKAEKKGQCEAEKTAQKETCEATKASEKGACESFKESYKRIRATGADYADVSSKDAVLSGSAKICLNQIAFDPKSLRLLAQLTVLAEAKASGHIKFTPLNVVGHLGCFAPFEKELATTVSVPSQPVNVDTSVTYDDDSSKAALQVLVSNSIHVHFPFATVAAKLATDPKFQILCPVPGTTMAIRAATPDKWWPSKIRGDIDRDLPDFRFELDLIRKPTTVGTLPLAGKLRRNEKGIGAVFTVAGQAAKV